MRGAITRQHLSAPPPRAALALPLLFALTDAASLGCSNDTAPHALRPRSTGSQTDGAASYDRDGGTAPGTHDDAAAATECELPGACDLLDRSSCGGEGQGCVFALPDADAEQPEAQCQPVGTGREGAACSSSADCGPGLDCTARDGHGQCHRYCCAPNTRLGCPAGQFCAIALTDARGEPTPVYLCDRCDTCDLRDPNACGAGLGCNLLPGLRGCRACLPAGTHAPGEACEYSNDCAPGAACARTASGNQACLAFCDLDASGTCPDDTRCIDTGDDTLPAGVGLCL
jgi:hypothetical protein